MQKKRICSYEKSTQLCNPIGLMILKTLIVQIVSVEWEAKGIPSGIYVLIYVKQKKDV